MAKDKSNKRLTNAFDLFGKSYAVVRRNLNVYALVYAIPAAMMVAGTIQLIDNSQRDGWNWENTFSSSVWGPNVGSDSSFETASAILAIVLFFGAIISYFLAVVLNLRAAQGKSVTFSGVWGELWRNGLWFKMIGLGLMTIFILVVGFVLLIIPGVILLWRLYLAPYILVDKQTTSMDALTISWNMTKGYAWPIYSIILFGVVLYLPSILPIVGGLLSFILGVAYAAAPALRYQEIKKASR